MEGKKDVVLKTQEARRHVNVGVLGQDLRCKELLRMWTFQLGVCHFEREGLGHEMKCRGSIMHTHFTLLSDAVWSEKPFGP